MAIVTEFASHLKQILLAFPQSEKVNDFITLWKKLSPFLYF